MIIMERVTQNRTLNGANRKSLSPRFCAGRVQYLWLLLLAATVALSGCGGGSGSSSGAVPVDLSLSGNWQFTMSPPADGSYLGGLEGGFLLENNGSATGGVTYSVSLPNLLIPCNRGSAMMTGTRNSQTVNLTAVAGTQTFTLTGTLSIDGLTMAGSYTSTAGTASDGSPCGTLQTVPMQWSAILVPPLMGAIQGSFHSAGGAAGLNEQDFLVSGVLNQAPNTGTSSAVLTGDLSFLSQATNASDYPCFTLASLYGQISGSFVTLQIVGADGTDWGLIGEPVGSLGSTGVNPVTFDSVHGILQGTGPSYSVATTACPGSLGSINTAGDFGTICLALNASACQQPISLVPSALIFPEQVIGSTPTTLAITLSNAVDTTLGGVTLSLANQSGATNFTETDACGLNGAPSLGAPFNMDSGQSCVVSVTFAPLESCAVGTPPDQCPSPLNATLTITVPGNGMILTVPITGTATSQGAFSIPQLDFDGERVREAKLLPVASFANSGHPVQTVASPGNRTLQDVEHHAEID